MLKAGLRLKETRLEQGISLEEVSKNTKIKVTFLEYIENGEYSKLPSVLYAQGFVKNYAKFLGIPDREIMPIFKREYDSDKAYRVLPKGFEAKDNFPTRGFRVRQTMLIGVVVFVFFIFYIVYQYRYAFINPPLQLYLPKENVVKTTEIIVSGSTDPNSTIYVNKETVTVSDNGRFIKSLNVFPGEFTISVKAINKFGRISEIKKSINVKPAY